MPSVQFSHKTVSFADPLTFVVPFNQEHLQPLGAPFPFKVGHLNGKSLVPPGHWAILGHAAEMDT